MMGFLQDHENRLMGVMCQKQCKYNVYMYGCFIVLVLSVGEHASIVIFQGKCRFKSGVLWEFVSRGWGNATNDRTVECRNQNESSVYRPQN
jgi:hypothetical protein